MASLRDGPNFFGARENLPDCFKNSYPNLRCTIDCTEFFIERPRELSLQALTWSDYKKHNTAKVMIGISPILNVFNLWIALSTCILKLAISFVAFTLTLDICSA
jgi:hypothetical protein